MPFHEIKSAVVETGQGSNRHRFSTVTNKKLRKEQLGHEEGREQAGHNTDGQSHTEAFDWAFAHVNQDDRSDQGRHIGINDGAKRFRKA